MGRRSGELTGKKKGARDTERRYRVHACGRKRNGIREEGTRRISRLRMSSAFSHL